MKNNDNITQISEMKKKRTHLNRVPQPPKDPQSPEGSKFKWKNIPTTSFRKLQQKSLGRILIQSAGLTEEQLKDALREQKLSSSRKLGEILIEKEFVTEDNMLQALAYQLDLPFYDRLPVADIDARLVENIPIQFCRDNNILPIASDVLNVTIAVSDPLNLFPIDDLRLVLSTNINVVISPPNVIDNAINRIYERSQDSSQKVIDELKVPEIDDDEEDLEKTRDLLEESNDDKPIIRLVNGLLSRSVKERASDIHIEPYENNIVVRFRIDGSLQDKMQIPRRHSGSLASRIKIIGKLNIAEKRVPQDGRISIRVAGKDIDVRLSVLPTAHGERIVMRLLDKSSGTKSLDQMGMEPELYKIWSNLLEQKHGIVLVTGPTGSGKSTFLYASLMNINTTDINILTIEDPVEYQLAGVGQIEVKEKVGLTFAEGLRSILRQDPDVVMIGEIRDSETAHIAIQASITGHLVFSTLHTNDTAATVSRLVDLEIEPFQIASAVLGVAATRLIRKLCPECREPHTLNQEEQKLLEMDAKDLEGYKIYKVGAGCEKCFSQGYKDRIGIYEILIFDDEIRSMLMSNPDAKSLKKLAIKRGMKTLREAALQKVLSGETSLEEAIQKTQTDDLN